MTFHMTLWGKDAKKTCDVFAVAADSVESLSPALCLERPRSRHTRELVNYPQCASNLIDRQHLLGYPATQWNAKGRLRAGHHVVVAEARRVTDPRWSYFGISN